MDNDFGRPMSPRERYNGVPQQPQLVPQPAAQPPAPERPQHYRRGGGFKKFLKFLLLLILVAAAAGGVYYWQQSKIDDLQKQVNGGTSQSEGLNAQLSTLKKQLTDLTKTNDDTLTDDLIPGQADVNRADGRILITAVFKPSNGPDELWIEYGETPAKLDKSTAHATKALGAGEGTYSFGQQLEIPKTSVKPGTSYFYRVVAKKGDKTTHSAIASFTSVK